MEYQTGLFFIQPIFAVAFNILMVIYRLVGENLGWAIIVFTLLLRLATLPFSLKQVSSAKKNKEFQDKYKAIQTKYKASSYSKTNPQDAASKERMTKELAALQGEYLPAQLGGCLPMILQLIFFFQVYYVVINLLNKGLASFEAVRFSFIPAFTSGQAANLNFFGMNLGQSASQVGTSDLGALLPYVVLIILMGATQIVSSRVMAGLSLIPRRKKKEDAAAKAKALATKKAPEDVSFSDAMQQSSQSMMYMLPLMTMLISISFPAGLSLYWTVSSGFAVFQQMIVKRDRVKAKLVALVQKINPARKAEPILKTDDKPVKLQVKNKTKNKSKKKRR